MKENNIRALTFIRLKADHMRTGGPPPKRSGAFRESGGEPGRPFCV